MSSSCLENTPNDIDEMVIICRWLRSLTFQPDVPTSLLQPELSTLHEALIRANNEIIWNLDQELQMLIDKANEPEVCIEVQEDAFVATRNIRWAALADAGKEWIRSLERDVVVDLLYAAKEEIAWLQHEMRRLECHIGIAEFLVAKEDRTSFGFVPTERNGRVVDFWRYLRVGKEEKAGCNEPKLGQGEIEDGDEMLLDNEARDRSRRSPAPEREDSSGDGQEDVEMEEGEVREESKHADQKGKQQEEEERRDSGTSTKHYEEKTDDSE